MVKYSAYVSSYFLEYYDWNGRRIISFCTNDGSGLGKSVSALKEICGGATVLERGSFISFQVQDSKSQIASWAKSIGNQGSILYQQGGRQMKVYIQATEKGLPRSINIFQAYQRFHKMGFETRMFSTQEELRTSQLEDVVVGYVDTVRVRLKDFDIVTPEIDYPEELQQYLQRKIWHSKINTINAHPELWPVFVKPVEDKKFTGIVVHSPKDLIGCGSCYDNADVICSEVISIKAEWRVFVRYNKILDMKPYKGDWRLHFNPAIIEQCVANYHEAPAGCAIDFGVTDKGQTILIEVNDGYALGSYSLFYLDYAKLLSARWAELTNSQDKCHF